MSDLKTFAARVREIARDANALPGLRTRLHDLAREMEAAPEVHVSLGGFAAAADGAEPSPESVSEEGEEPLSARVCPNCRGDSEVFAPGLCPTCNGTGIDPAYEASGKPLTPGEIEWLTTPEDEVLEAMLKDMLQGIDTAMGVRAGELLRFYEPAEACARARAEFMHDRERVTKALVDIRMRQTPRFEVRQ